MLFDWHGNLSEAFKTHSNRLSYALQSEKWDFLGESEGHSNRRCLEYSHVGVEFQHSKAILGILYQIKKKQRISTMVTLPLPLFSHLCFLSPYQLPSQQMEANLWVSSRGGKTGQTRLINLFNSFFFFLWGGLSFSTHQLEAAKWAGWIGLA